MNALCQCLRILLCGKHQRHTKLSLGCSEPHSRLSPPCHKP
jgi:hypothetical protein